MLNVILKYTFNIKMNILNRSAIQSHAFSTATLYLPPSILIGQRVTRWLDKSTTLVQLGIHFTTANHAAPSRDLFQKPSLYICLSTRLMVVTWPPRALSTCTNLIGWAVPGQQDGTLPRSGWTVERPNGNLACTFSSNCWRLCYVIHLSFQPKTKPMYFLINLIIQYKRLRQKLTIKTHTIYNKSIFFSLTGKVINIISKYKYKIT